MSEETKKISTALEFKQRREAAEKGEVIELAGSGLSVRVKRPQINKLIAMGHIPDRLASFMIKADQGEVKPGDLPELLEMQRIIATHSVVEPKVTETPDYDKGEISPEDLEDADVASVWIWFNGGTAALDKFRNDREGNVARPSVSKVSGAKAK